VACFAAPLPATAFLAGGVTMDEDAAAGAGEVMAWFCNGTPPGGCGF